MSDVARHSNFYFYFPHMSVLRLVSFVCLTCLCVLCFFLDYFLHFLYCVAATIV